LCEEAAVSVTKDEGAAAGLMVEELREVVAAGVFEGSAEGEIFEPAIGAGDRIEVGFGSAHR
jgi:hypothetical protein